MSKTSPDNKIWHSNCLKCCKCNQLLDSKYFELNGRLYCRNDYITFFGPSCTGCGNKIDDEQYFFSIDSRSTSVGGNNNHPFLQPIKNNNNEYGVEQSINKNTINDEDKSTNRASESDNIDNTLNPNGNINKSGNEDSSDNNNKTETNSQSNQNIITSLFFHDKCFICNYCARPLQKGDKYCILENTPTSSNQSMMICHDICAIKMHTPGTNSVHVNEDQPIRQTTTKSGAPRARRGRTKQQPG